MLNDVWDLGKRLKIHGSHDLKGIFQHKLDCRGVSVLYFGRFFVAGLCFFCWSYSRRDGSGHFTIVMQMVALAAPLALHL